MEDADLLKDGLEGTGHRLSQQPSVIKHGIMREYQMQGLNWLIHLYDNGINGILADEMVRDIAGLMMELAACDRMLATLMSLPSALSQCEASGIVCVNALAVAVACSWSSCPAGQSASNSLLLGGCGHWC